MKLLIALTNNWADYGGMDVYTVNLGGKYHDDVSCPPHDRQPPHWLPALIDSRG